jgi:hypothetical protein
MGKFGRHLILSGVVAMTFGVSQPAVAAGQGQAIDNLALGQVGAKETNGCNCGRQIDQFTEAHHEAWCADFVSWVYNQAGHPFTGGIHGWRIPSAEYLRQWFVQRSWFHARTSSDVPQTGDVVSFTYAGGRSDHVGIVDRVEGTTLYTVEGNANNAVIRKRYLNYRANTRIMGWGRLDSAPAGCVQ